MQNALQSVRKIFSIAKGHHRKSNEECYEEIAELISVHEARGIAIGEDPHGDYAYARFVGDLLPALARAGVKKFYTEVMHTKDQHIIDWWQNTGKTHGMINHFNKHKGGVIPFIEDYRNVYAPFMWHEYWKVLQVAHANGMRVMAIDPDRYRVNHPGLHILDKNIAWEQFITADQKKAPAPYILYCGEVHFPNRKMAAGGAVIDWLDIPGIRLRHGAVGFYPSPFSSQTYHSWRQPAHDQGWHLNLRVFKPVPIPHND